MDILSAAKRHHMFDAGDIVLVAVSGGPDSVALLHALHTRADEFGITLHVAHLNHGIRGEASDLDEHFVKELAANLGLACTIGRADIPALKKELHTCEEDAARTARYNFLQETAAELSASKIAVGHNADDRAESLLLNLIRGSGIDGLGSIRPVRGNIVRPLLDTPRREIEAYIEEHRLPFRIDESNMDLAYSRNRIRHELLPLLESNYNPEIRAALMRMADIASETSDFIALAAATSRLEIVHGDSLDADMLERLPIAVQRQIVRMEIERAKGDLKDVSLEQVDRVLEAMRGGGDFTITLPTGRIYAVRQENELTIQTKQIEQTVEPFEIALNVPGITSLPNIGCTIKAEFVANPTARKLPPNETMIDVAAINGALRLRNICHGDRIVPFGMSSSKKLQDIFVDKKIARRDRSLSVVVVDDENILWVAGVVSSEIGRIRPETQRGLHLTVR